MLELDIWGNVTHANIDNVWYKQTFLENELIKYEDSKGNYWTKEFGQFPYYTIKVEFHYMGLNGGHVMHFTHRGEVPFIVVNNLSASTFKGYVYAPYIPIQVTPTSHVNGTTMATSLALTSRYAKKIVNSSFYGAITIAPTSTPLNICLLE